MTSNRSSKAAQTRFTEQEALQFHSQGKPGKLEITPTKPLATQRDLSLAYSPGVAVPVHAIHDNPSCVYDYTNKGNLVAVVSNGTAILGLGNLGALAAKPVMEGKGALFKRFADIDAMDLLVDTEDVDAFINCVRYLAPSFGGINLEDIKAPDCFIIEQKLKELLDIPVFHDDQHGTAIIAAAGLINALALTGRDMKTCRLVVNGAGAAGIACLELVVAMGHAEGERHPLRYQGRHLPGPQGRHEPVEVGVRRQDQGAHAGRGARGRRRAVRPFGEGRGDAGDGRLAWRRSRSSSRWPIPIPRSRRRTCSPCAMTRSSPPGAPTIPTRSTTCWAFPSFSAAPLDVQASTINEAMKIAAAEALAELARSEVPDQVAAAFFGRRPTFGPEYIIPAPFDPRLIVNVPAAVAKAAMDSGVARKPIVDMEAYVAQLEGRLDPMAGWLQSTFSAVRADPKRVVFAEGEEPAVIRAAHTYFTQGFGQPILVGTGEVVREQFRALGMALRPEYELIDTRKSPYLEEFTEYLYARLQRRGYLKRDCHRLVTNERNVFAALMVVHGYADAMVSGVTRNWTSVFQDVHRVMDPEPDRNVIGVSLALLRGRAVLIADTSVHAMPTAEQLADIAVEAARAARNFGIEPRVALLAYSTFGQPRGERSDQVREAIQILDERRVDFEYDGDMAADVALNRELMRHYPFCRLTDTANVLVMPAFHAASISTKMLKELGGATVIGPILVGLSHSVQICRFGAKDTDIVNMAAIAAYGASH